MMRTPRPTIALLTILATGLALTGCSVGFTPGAGRAQPAAADPSPTTAPSGAAATTPPTPTAAATAVGGTIAAARERLAPSANVLSCQDGALDVSAVAAIVRVDGPCEALTVSGTGAVVFAATVGTLTVTAAAAVVAVDSADAVSITGDAVGAVVGWSGGQPRVTDQGTASVLGPIGKG